MEFTSLWPFVLMWLLFALTAGVIIRLWPLYRTLIPQLLNKKGYRSELEGLRGVLACSVVVHHAVTYRLLLYNHVPEITGRNANFYSQLGVASVTGFFFITGFLFWSKILNQPKLSFRRFMRARLRRLGPAYLSGLAAVLLAVAILTHFQLRVSPASLLQDLLGMFVAQRRELNGLISAPWMWGVTWTLRLEFLFYLVIPLLGWFAVTLRKSLFFLLLCCFTYLAIRHVGNAGLWLSPGFSNFNDLVRFISTVFFVGMLSSHLVRIPKVKELGQSVWAAPISLAIIVITLCFVPAVYGLKESFCLSIPFIAVACGCTFWGILRSGPVLLLGQISYSLYLLHNTVYGLVLTPLYNGARPLIDNVETYWGIVFLITPLIIVIATLWHRTFELPFLSNTPSNSAAEPAASSKAELSMTA